MKEDHLIDCPDCVDGYTIYYTDGEIFPDRCETCGGLGEIDDNQYEEAMDLKYMERSGK